MEWLPHAMHSIGEEMDQQMQLSSAHLVFQTKEHRGAVPQSKSDAVGTLATPFERFLLLCIFWHLLNILTSAWEYDNVRKRAAVRVVPLISRSILQMCETAYWV